MPVNIVCVCLIHQRARRKRAVSFDKLPCLHSEFTCCGLMTCNDLAIAVSSQRRAAFKHTIILFLSLHLLTVV